VVEELPQDATSNHKLEITGKWGSPTALPAAAMEDAAALAVGARPGEKHNSSFISKLLRGTQTTLPSL